MATVRIVLVEDHTLTRVGLRTMLQQCDEFEIVGEAATGSEGLELLCLHHPDVALIDIDLPDLNGIQLVRKLRILQADAPDNLPSTHVMMLTMHDQEEQVLAAFGAGADSYCVKNAKTELLLEAVRETAAGHSWIDPAIANIVLTQVRSGNLLADATSLKETESTPTEPTSPSNPDQELVESLSPRELEVLEQIVAGYSNQEIGEKLYLSLGTVKTHVRNILGKLAVSDRTQAAVRALRSGLVE